MKLPCLLHGSSVLLLLFLATTVSGFQRFVPTSFVVSSSLAFHKNENHRIVVAPLHEHEYDGGGDNDDEYGEFLSNFNPSELDQSDLTTTTTTTLDEHDEEFEQDFGGRSDVVSSQQQQQPRQQKPKRHFQQRIDPGRQYEEHSSEDDDDDTSYDYSNKGEGRMRAKLQRKIMSKYGHDYIRANVDDSPMMDNDLQTIHDLLSLRLQLRLKQEWDESDAIRRQLLKDYGVRVFDTERVWRTGCDIITGEGMDWYPGRLRHAEKKKLAQEMRSNSNSDGNDSSSYYNVGHNYKRHHKSLENKSDFDEDEIHELLATRLEYRKEKNFEAADSILRKLNNGGVYVQDKIKEWRYDGKTFSRPMIQIMPDPVSAPFVNPILIPEIQQMVNLRQKAWQKRDYDAVKEYQLRLSEEYGVGVDERHLIWQYGPRFSNAKDERPYTRCPFDDSSKLDEEQIQHITDLLQSHLLARQQGNYAIADRLKEEVISYGIDVHDGLRQWRSVAKEEEPKKTNPLSAQLTQSFKKGWTRKESDTIELSLDDEVKIRNLLRLRLEARDARLTTRAKEIKNTLRTKHRVLIDDVHLEWWVSKTMLTAEEEDYENHAYIDDDETTFMVNDDSSVEATLDALSDDLTEPTLKAMDDDDDDDDGSTILSFDEMQNNDDETTILSVDELSTLDNDDNDELSSLTVMELKDRLRANGLKVTGNKAELIERLKSSIVG